MKRVRGIDVDQYRYGFETLIESDKAPKGLSEDTVKFISEKKNEPPGCCSGGSRPIALADHGRADLGARRLSQDRLPGPLLLRGAEAEEDVTSLDEIDPEILKTYEKLGIPLREVANARRRRAQAGRGRSRPRKIAVDAVFDSVSVATTFKAELKKAGVIFMPISEAIREHPELVQKYLGSVVPTSDNFYATLNSAVFSDGSFVYVPPGVRCPMELSTYFPHQRAQHRPVRAHAHHRRQGLLRQLSRGLHRAAARREPAACRRGRARRA